MKGNYLSYREAQSLRRGAWMGGFVGLLIGGVVAAVVGLALDSWREANHELLKAEAIAKVNRDLDECKRIAVDLGMMEGARNYEELVALARSVYAAQEAGGVR